MQLQWLGYQLRPAFENGEVNFDLWNQPRPTAGLFFAEN
jgi:hypothetical protein